MFFALIAVGYVLKKVGILVLDLILFHSNSVFGNYKMNSWISLGLEVRNLLYLCTFLILQSFNFRYFCQEYNVDN